MADNRSEASSASGVSDSSSVQKETTRKKKAQAQDGEEDLLEQKKSLREGIFACMYTLSREKLFNAWQYDLIKIVMEGLTGFIICFNPTIPQWEIHTDNWFWKIIRWSTYQSPVARTLGYDAYVKIFYVHVAVIYTTLALVAALTFGLRRSQQSKALLKVARWLQFVTDVVFSILYMTILDYMCNMFACNWSGDMGHVFFADVQCTSGAHMIHVIVAAITAILFVASTACLMVAGCDLNPDAKANLASPAAVLRLKVLCAKAVYVAAMAVLRFTPKVQAIITIACTSLIWYWNWRNVPFYNKHINYIWSSMWLGITYTAGILVALTFSKKEDDPDYQRNMTLAVLYGIFAVIAGGAVLQWAYIWYKMRNAQKFINPPADMKLKKIHAFEDAHDVELIARAMRVHDVDGNMLPEAAELGERIIKAGMATFPNDPHLLILYANFLMEVKHDGPASRTQLQLAGKHSPSLVQRYEIFKTVENSKRLKDSTEGQLDLQVYLEFKRNYRAVTRVHREALQAQRDFWRSLMHSHAKMAKVRAMLEELDAQTERAQQVYRRVMERYPGNGRLIKCYGKFLEDCRNDMGGAARYYTEANRQGGNGDALMSMDFDFTGQGKPEFLTTMDLHEDAVIVIDAVGTIMLCTDGVIDMFGYQRSDLENANVAMLMPQPFSGRHASYLQRYVGSGEPHILDSVREVVALHKDKYVFPLDLCVTKLSGIGADCVFLGLLRHTKPSTTSVRVWVSPIGSVLCCDQQFSTLVGMQGEELVGRMLASICTDATAADALIATCQNVACADFAAGLVTAQLQLHHKYLAKVPVAVTVALAGTDTQRIFVMNMARTDGKDEGLIVSDSSGALQFITHDVATMLGYTVKKAMTLRLDALIPAPYNLMHSKWIKDQPAQIPSTSCRSGTVVFLQSSTSVQCPVKLTISSLEDREGMKHVVRVAKVGPQDFEECRCVQVTTDIQGHILHVTPPTSTVYGWPASELSGLHIADVVNVFEEWAERVGSKDMRLLMLSLIDREHELPGCSWRVSVKPPPVILAKAQATSQDRTLASVLHGRQAAQQTAPKTAVMITEPFEENEQPRVRLHLWRRDMLTGSVELDRKLHIRRADPMMGLIVGLPSSALIKQPLHKFLDIPHGTLWEELMGVKKAAGGLKNSMRGTLSPAVGFEGAHPDGGTMRLILQGVPVSEGLGARTKVEATVRPDTAFAGARANVLVALGLEKARNGAGSSAVSSRSADSSEDDAKSQAADGLGLKASTLRAVADEAAGMEEPDEDGKDMKVDEEEDEGATAIRKAQSSEFVARWVKMVSSQEIGEGPADGGSAKPGLGTINEDETGKARGGRARRGSVQVAAADQEAVALAAAMPDEALVEGGARGHHHHRHRSSGLDGPPGDDDASESSAGDKEDDQRSAALSAATTQREEVLVDSRRGRVLRKLTKLLTGATVMVPLQRCHTHTYIVLGTMLVAHVVCYVIITTLIASQHLEVYKVHRNALAADRSKVIITRAALYEFGRRIYENGSYNIPEDNAMQQVVDKAQYAANLAASIRDLAEYHQGVYMGFGKVAQLPGAPERQLWEQPSLNMTVYEDTDPPGSAHTLTGLFPYGNRFISNAMQIVWIVLNAPLELGASRSYQFLLDNSNALFEGYTLSLDYLMAYAWRKLDKLKVGLLVLLVVEVLVIQLACVLYQLWLVAGVERARMTHLLIMLGLPGPILRTLASRPVKILDDDSDYGSDDEDDTAAKQQAAAKPTAEEEAAGDGGGKARRASNAGAAANTLALEGAKTPGAGAPPPPPTHPQWPSLMHKQSTEGTEEADDDMPPATGAFAKMAAAESNRRRSIEAAPVGGVGAGARRSLELVDPGMVQPGVADAEMGGVALFSGRKKGSRRGPPGGDMSLTKGSLTFNGKTLLPSYRTTWVMIAPFLVWEAALLVIYAVSYVQLADMQKPLAALNMASHVIYRYTHIRCTALLLIVQETDAGKDHFKAELKQQVDYLNSEYNTLMYGGMAVTQEGSAFLHETPPAAFISKDFSNNFFRDKDCFRWNTSDCLTAGHRFYEVSHNGLDAMLRRAITEMSLLASDDNADITYLSQRYDYMYLVGIQDLYQGLQTSAELFVKYAIKRYDAVSLLHTVLLAVTCVLVVLYALALLRPYVKKVKREAVRVAGLLSHVPQEMDVGHHARAVMRAKHGAAGGASSRGGGGSTTAGA